MTNQVFIDGDADEIQLRVQSHSTLCELTQTEAQQAIDLFRAQELNTA